MAVPKKKTSKQRSSTRYQTYVKKQQKKLMNFVERAMRNERGAMKIAAREDATPASSPKITKIEA